MRGHIGEILQFPITLFELRCKRFEALLCLAPFGDFLAQGGVRLF